MKKCNCKSCINRPQFKTHEEFLNYYRAYREKNREKAREYNKIYNKKWRKENGYHNEAKWAKENPNKISAEQALRYQIKIGKIKRKACEVCKETKTHAHHTDYTKPLTVKWLCALHHKEEHINANSLSPNHP